MATAYEYVVDIRAGFAKLSGDINGVTNQFKRLERDVGGIFSNIGKMFTAGLVISGVAAIGKLNTALVDLAKRGEAVGSVAEGFQKLGGSTAAIKQAQQATIGLVSSFDLMKIANQAMLKGVPDVNKNFGLLAEYAGRVANTLDQDTTTALGNLVNALSSVKDKQLLAMGITIDADKAYRKFAEANKIAAVAGKSWEDVLTSQQEKLAKQAAVVEAVIAKTGKLAPVTDSVANAEQAFGKALDEVRDKISVAVNNSEALRDSYRSLTDIVNSLDWEEIAAAVDTTATAIIDLATKAIPLAIPGLRELGQVGKLLFSKDLRSELEQATDAYRKLGEQIAEAEAAVSKGKNHGGWTSSGKASDSAMAALDAQVEDLKAKLPEAQKKILDLFQAVDSGPKAGASPIGGISDDLDDIPEAATKAADAVAKVIAKINQDSIQNLGDITQRGLSDAIEALDTGAFEKYLEDLRVQTRDGILAGYSEAWASLPKASRALGLKNAEDAATLAVDSYQRKFNDAATEFGKKQADESKAAAEKAKKFYEDTATGIESAFKSAYSNAANGDWREGLLDIGITLAANIAAAIKTGVTENPGVMNGFAEIGTAIAKGISEALGLDGSNVSSGGGGADTGAEIGKIASSAGQAYFNNRGDKVEPIGQNNDGSFIYPESSGGSEAQSSAPFEASGGEYAAAGGTVAGAFTKKNKPNTNSAAGAQTGAVVGTIVGAYFGQPALGAQIGSQLGEMIGTVFKTGLNHAESKARVGFEQWLENQFKNLKKVRYYGADGKLSGYFDGDFKGKQLTQDFNSGWNEDGTAKVAPVWGSNMDKWGKTAKSTFLGLGEALKELQGITDDIGAQLGYILGTTLAGNVDNARLLVQQLGLDFETVSEALLKGALKGTYSWLAFNSYIRDTAEAFKPGLAAVGAIGDAFQNLIDSAGQGREAVKSFKDIAVEAMEAGVTSMEQLRQFLIGKGFDPEYVDALITSAINRGIDTLKEWSEASDAAAGSVVGDMEAASTKLQDEWNKMRDSLKELSEGLKEIPKEVNTTVKIKVKTEYDKNTKEVVDGLGQGALPGAVPNEGERNLSEQFAAKTGRSGRNSPQAASAAGRVLAARMSGQNPFTWNGNASLGPITVPAPSTPGKPYQWGAGGMDNRGNPNLPDNTSLARRPGTTNINIDAKGAGAGVERQIIDAANYVEQKVMRNILGHITQTQTRGGRAADNY